jgi:arsenate-mycothiol transferase
MSEVNRRPAVLFVCVKNGGKSQMAAGLLRKIAGDRVDVDSAGTKPGAAINGLSAQTLLELGVDITSETPKQLTDDLVRSVDRVIVLGRDAEVQPVDDTPVETWDTDEPSERGIDGIERMRIIRDDINRRVEQLMHELGVPLRLRNSPAADGPPPAAGTRSPGTARRG